MRTALWPDAPPEEVAGVLAWTDEEGVVLVSESGSGTLDGYAEVSVRPFADGCDTGPLAYLEGLWTAPERRRSGLATGLVEAAAEWAEGRGFTELGSGCTRDNAASAAFHTSAGFEHTETVLCFRRELGGAGRAGSAPGAPGPRGHGDR